jgi:hypothetical protein
MSIMLGSAPSTGICPPLDWYTLEIVGVADQVVKRPKFEEPETLEDNLDMTFQVIGVPDDFEEEDAQQWVGFEFQKYVRIPRKLSNEAGTLNKIIRAARNLPKIDDDFKISASDLIGDKLMAEISPSDNNWPRLTAFRPLRKRTKPAPKPAPPVADDGDDWPDE